MGHPVVVEVGACGEAFPADLALVGFFPRVDAAMCVQGTGRGEGFTTYVTRVRLFTCRRENNR